MALIEDLEREMSSISMELYIQQQLEYISYRSKAVSEYRKDLVGYQIRTETHVVENGVETDICSICHDDYVEGDSVGFLDCRHTFHCDCVKTWLVINNTCPLCKSVAVQFYC